LPRLDIDALERARSPYIEPAVQTFMAAANVEAGLQQLVRLRASYRSVQQTGGILERRLGFGAVSQPLAPLRLDAHSVFDLLTFGLIDGDVAASLVGAGWTARAQLERHVPRFDPSSIWAYFDVAPIWMSSLRLARSLGSGFDAAIGVQARRTDLPSGAEQELGFDARASLHDERDTLSMSGFGWAGGTGPLWGGSLAGSRRISLPIRVEAEVSLMRIDDPQRAALAGVSLYELLGAHFTVSDESEIEVEITHAQSRAAGDRFSVLAFLHLGAWR
jgi:hypothetical protein